ncbi:hypothetical protein YC2023_100131 [Brassica napus]
MEKLSIEGRGEDLEEIGVRKPLDLEKVINKSEKGIMNRGPNFPLTNFGLKLKLKLKQPKKKKEDDSLLSLKANLKQELDVHREALFTEEHMAENVKERADGSAELVKSMGDKHASVIRPAARYYSAIKDAMVCGKGRYTLVKDVDDVENGAYDKPLPCFGCGIGWFSFLLGFVFPLLWYYATFLYFGNYYRKDPRERAGLAASAITAMGFSLLLLVIAVFRWF